MTPEQIEKLLNQVKNGEMNVAAAAEKLRSLPFEDLEFVKVDHHRALRCGFAEVIFCPGKTDEQIASIFERIARTGSNVLATRARQSAYELVRAKYPDAVWDEQAKGILLMQTQPAPSEGKIAIVTGGTSDLPVAAEAKLTAQAMGQQADLICDVGVAGLHRLLPHVQPLQQANVIIAVAGMEGALPSVVAGLVNCPVIAVPTSVGYGAGLNGIAPLLAMLNSCASGVTVVNIDNGFGAGYAASLINAQICRKRSEK